MSNRNELNDRLVACVQAVADGKGLKQALGVSDRYIATVQDKAHELYLSGRFEQARELCVGLIRLTPDRFYPHLLLSDVLRSLGEDDASYDSVAKAYRLEPGNGLVCVKYAQALMQRGDCSAAREILERVCDGSRWKRQARVLSVRCDSDRVAS